MGGSQQSAGGINAGSAIDFIHSDSANSNGHMQQEPSAKDTHVLTTFTWTLGGNTVFVTGTFTSWTNHMPLQRDGHIFTTTIELDRGEHHYKFIVDGEWRFSPEDPTKPDAQGNINNYIDTTSYKALSKNVESGKSTTSKEISAFMDSKRDHKALVSFNQFNENAPKLPSLFATCDYLDDKDSSMRERSPNKKISLKSNSRMDLEMNGNGLEEKFDLSHLSKQDIADIFDSPHSLAPPTHVVLNHMGLKKLDKNYNVYAITHRFKSKYTTYKFYTHQRKSTMDL